MITVMPQRPAIILDCDPGHDDAMAIVVAAHTTDLLGITAVAGNAPLDRTEYNARVIRDLLDLDVEVHAGAERPLVAEPRFAAFIHGESGLHGADLPPPTRPLDGTNAAAFIVDTCRANPGTWLVPVGPLTNIAVALRSDPGLRDHVAGISLMGGGTYGNRSAAAEFNIWADPHAAAIVFESGIPVTMAGLDVTHQFLVTSTRVEEMRACGGPFAELMAELFEFFVAAYLDRHDRLTGAALHDPLAVLAVARPAFFTSSMRHVVVETTGEHTAGMTVIDRRDVRTRPDPNTTVLETVDDAAAWAIVLDALRAAPN